MAASQGMKGGGSKDVDTVEKQECRSASESTVEDFLFVACAEVKREPEEAANKEVGTFEESCAECEVCIKEEMIKAGSFEEISVPGCNVHIKKEVEEAEAIAVTPALERDPLTIEEEKVAAGTRGAAAGGRLLQSTNLECRRAARKINCVMSPRSARCGRRRKGRRHKSTSTSRDSGSGGGKRDDFTCDSCQKTFRSKYVLLLHVFIHMDDVRPPLHVCRLCAEVFASRRALLVHSKTRDTQCTVAKKDGVLSPSSKRGTCRKLQSFKCTRVTAEHRHENVSLRFQQTQIDISQRERTDSDRYQKRISKGFALTKHKQAQAQAKEGPNARHKSNTSLMPPVNLKRHNRVHSVDLPFKCNICDRYFKHEVHLKQHAVSHGKKQFLCNYCERTFNRPFDLRQHILSHTGEKPYVCECGKSFAKSFSLKRHVMVHTGERPYSCNVCFKSFTEASVLRKHVVVHTGERAHVCAECDKAFKEAGHLRRHLLLHTGVKPHVCPTCGTCFTQGASLKTHARMHTGEKPYQCHVCLKSFADRSNWRAHLFAYHTEEIHKCAICEKRFVTRHDLVQHVRMHIL